MRVPRILSHVFDSESKTATLGYMVFLTATTGLFYGHVINADTWLLCVVIASTLIGGKLVGETILAAKLGKLPPPKETSDAPCPVVPPAPPAP